jgi:hypothetical protein
MTFSSSFLFLLTRWLLLYIFYLFGSHHFLMKFRFLKKKKKNYFDISVEFKITYIRLFI